ncbi:hypothetical protein Aduo_017610 [Ancylostoma duodenale]
MHRQSVLLVALSLAVEAAGPSWGDWGEWGAACTACTGAASRGRTRVCIPGDDSSWCSGSRLEQEMCLDCTAQWSEWTVGTVCSDDCGFCGKFNRTRQCSNAAGCPAPTCVGDSSDQNTPPCDTGDVCTFPKPSCCSGTKAVDMDAKRFYCKTA